MPTQQQIDAALKAWYSQSQIDSELQRAWVAPLAPATVEQYPNLNKINPNKWGITPLPWAVTPDQIQAPAWATYAEQNILPPSVTGYGVTPTQPQNPQPQTTVQQPVPWSASSIFWPENTFENQYYKNLNDQYNTPVDEEAIRRQKQADYQAQLDSVKAIYADQLNQARVRGQGRQGSSSAIQARRGLLGSNVGEAMTNNIETLNVQEQDLVRQEEANAIAAIQGLIRSWANEEIAAKKLAIKEGGEKLLAYYSGAGDRKAKKTSDAAKKLLALGKDPSAISDADLATAGIDKNDLLIAYNEQQSAFARASQEDADKRAKAELDTQKTKAEIAKLNADASRNYEIWGIIYWPDWTKIGTKVGNNYEAGGSVYEAGTNKYIWPARSVSSGGGGSTTVNVPWTVVTTKIGNKNVTMNSTALAGLQNAIANMPGAIIGSTGRSYEEQAKLYEAYKNGTGWLAAPPWSSKHETGLGIDLYGGTWADGKLLPPTQQMIQQMEANWFKWMNLPGDAGHFEYAGSGGLSDLAQSVQKGIITIAQIPAAQRAGIAQELARSGAETPKTQEIQRNIDLVDSLLNSTSLNKITGNIQGRLPWVALGGDAQLALNQFEQVKNLLSLDSREKLKGTGAVSDFESKMLAAAASSLGRNLSDADFKAELQKIRDIFDGKYKYLTNDADIKNVQNTLATGNTLQSTTGNSNNPLWI